MSKIVCIYPQDATTDFLRPLCDHICATFDAVEVGYDTSGDDEPMEIIFNEIKDAVGTIDLGNPLFIFENGISTLAILRFSLNKVRIFFAFS